MARFYDKGTHKVNFTEAEEKAQDEHEAAVAKEKAANAYVYARQIAYPSIGNQLDALWKGGDDQAAMKVIVDKVKSDNPKE